MEEIIKKWELILQQDNDRDITYGRNVLEEMLTDVKMAVKNNAVLPLVSGSLPDTRGDKIRKHINPCNHFIDWLIDNGQPKYKVLYDKLEQYKNESYGNDR